ncbi:MAG TPA: hypothetical protein VG406_18485 [Isosphaeraceae bacterium]|jgi:hypothetical protein|nr:hypothetical protein [Isosphaeraceae bacterium]
MRSLWNSWLDRRDDRRARRRRQVLGRRRWLVSWRPRRDGWWVARVSCPSDPETIERAGASRIEAIDHAERALAARLAAPPIDDDPT